MRKSGNKVLVIVLIVIALVVIAGGAFAYAYFATDMLKSGQELFAKYLTQNVQELSQTASLKKIDEIEAKLKQNKYEENIAISYTEAEETEPILEISLDTQNDSINKKTYGILSLMVEGFEEPLEVEYMNENDMYSLRFTNSVKQFLTVQNSDLKQLAIKLGIDEETAEQVIPDTIDFEKISLEKLSFTEEEENTEINKYVSLLYSNISKQKYTKSKNVVITVNGKTVTTNAYILTLNMQDIKNLEIKLLETLKQDEIILSKLQMIDEMIQEYIEESLKESFIQAIQETIDGLNEEVVTEDENIVITVYEGNGKTVRIKAEQGLDSIALDTTRVEDKKQIDINFTSMDEENTQLSYKVTFVKENDNNLNIQFTNIDGEEQQTTEIIIELSENENNSKLDWTFIDNQEGKTIFSRNINFVDEIDYKVVLNNSNNMILNELTSEQIATIFSAVGPRLVSEYVEPLEPVFTPILALAIINQGQDEILNSDLNEAETFAFNSKFQVYEGTNISTAEVNSLLNTVIKHNTEEANELTERYVIVTGDITIEIDDTSITEITGSNYYNVQCKTNEDGLINEIVITENEDVVPSDSNSINEIG